MDQEVKIQQYVLLAKGARGRGLTEIIAKATADPGVFGFGELLDVPNIKELQGTDLSPHYALLQLFAFGTWSDYQANAGSFPQLLEQQVLKLKQLTVASLAASQKASAMVLPYSQLQASLQIGSVRELEDFLINHCFYTGVIIAGKLDQKQACLQVHDVLGRDVRPEQLPDLIQRMARWIAAGDELLRAIEGRVSYATATSDAARQHREELEARIEEVKRAIKVGFCWDARRL
ncbi:hypothetical protein VOLCADRAFT_81770 [Volvox carteri f. nagariensis]|uniref:PCI domain-containing protein n=1 Tax=Volvox carteri f. nagariensis TaxID=3068 RepID=D8U0K6_VOLCA|nr:uncharacterized protein VOLCADRAFT_81770 [Volvox carteri f. nagariensis]EFJ46735.1 hypothetical protein VOLCADRAFT_81770 [Volvox carteri f. nagariensis]|eukprot:XP_002952264.1 hypothetical protein VOLCADRAFT_81770 [Volvox carteri f. nagariensis]